MASIRGGKDNTADGDFGGKLTFHTRTNGGVDTKRLEIDQNGQGYFTGGFRVGGLYITALQGNGNTIN